MDGQGNPVCLRRIGDREMTTPTPRRVLMIGNSFCYYFLDELWGMANAAGIDCRFSGVIAGAATLEQHWNWHENGDQPYCLHTADENGITQVHGLSLTDCFSADDWDVISYQDGEHYYRTEGFASAMAHMEPYLGNLVRLGRAHFPDAAHLFHAVWAYQIGYARDGLSFRVDSAEIQQAMQEDLDAMAEKACRDHALCRVPTGAAWTLARADARIGDTLCMPDCLHDGETGGGQYLNACVWFEVLFGRSCIGNPFRPTYALDEEAIAILQACAHAAVSADGQTTK